MKKIALISEHASPLAVAGSVDSGGQNVYVAHVARELARAGVQVDVFTRKDNPALEPEHAWLRNVRVIHVPAGPDTYLPKEQLLPHMDAFSDYLMHYFGAQARSYDAIHANFFMSAMAALPVSQRYGIPLAVTFHALGKVRRQHQQEADLFPDSRFDIEEEIIRRADRIIAECPQDRRDLMELYGADPRRIAIVPCGYDAAEMRQAGISQQTAANMIAVRIGHAASDGAGSIHERQYLASMVGAAATHILRLTYSLPIYATAMERDLAPVAAGRAVYELCMEGKL